MPERNKNWKQWIMPAALLVSIIISFALYWGTLHGDFVLDDVLFNQRDDYHQTSHLLKVWDEPYLETFTAIYRPLSSFTFVANYVFFGDDQLSFHVVNILLNALAVWLVFYFVYKLFEDCWLSFFAAAFFAVQPFHRIPVGNIKNRDEILYAIFAILAMLAFMKAREWFHNQPAEKKKRYLWMTLSALCAFVALASKEMGVVTPLMVLAVYYIQEKPKLKEIIKTGLWYVPLTLVFILMRWHILGPYMFANDTVPIEGNIYLSDLGFWTGLWTAGKIAFIYLTKMFVPYHLSMDYTYNQVPWVTNLFKSWQAIIGYLMLLGLVLLLFIKKKEYRPLVYGAALFLVPYLIVSKILFKFGGQTVEENWMYLPSLGISIIVGYLFVKLFNYKHSLAIGLFLILCAIYAKVDVDSNQMWQNELTMALDRAKQSPQSADAHFVLAQQYYNNKDFSGADAEMEKARIIYDSPDLEDAYGQIDMSLEKYNEAVGHFEKAVNSAPNEENFLLHYALALAKNGRYEDSIKAIAPWYEMDPNTEQLRYILAVDYYKIGKIDLAKQYLDQNSGQSLDQQLMEINVQY